jgi:hypothetical protein
MKTFVTALTVCAATLISSSAFAQEKPAPPAPPAKPAVAAVPAPPPPPPPPAPPGEPVNVRIDINVIDEGGPQAIRERVTLTTVDRQEASLRSDAEAAPVPGTMPKAIILNVDATPFISGVPRGKIRLRVGLDYLPQFTGQAQRGTRTRLQFTVIVDDGKTIVASETSDPATDRRVRVEVTATMLK